MSHSFMLLTRLLLLQSLCSPSSRSSPWNDLQLGPRLTSPDIIIVIIIIVIIIVIIITFLSPSASLSLCHPDRSKQRAAHLESRICSTFLPVNGQFFVATVAECCSWWLVGSLWNKESVWPALFVKCLEITVVVIWRYINKVNWIELNWMDSQI